MEEIKNKIIKGELREGDKLPSQDKLAVNLGVSRGTLREALNQLVLMGIIEMKQGNGTYVRSITPSSFMNSLSPALVMDKTSAGELLYARLTIEGAVAHLAAKKSTNEDINKLREILDGMRRDFEGGNMEGFTNKDLEFHILIAQNSKNRVLMRVVQTIREVLYQFIGDFFTAMPTTARNALDYHTRIFKAIERHDEREAKRQMEAHIQSLIRILNQSKRKISNDSGIDFTRRHP